MVEIIDRIDELYRFTLKESLQRCVPLLLNIIEALSAEQEQQEWCMRVCWAVKQGDYLLARDYLYYEVKPLLLAKINEKNGGPT